MPGVVVIGAQWGDEGKGKLVDVFSANADYVVRFHGGTNAGHTLVVNNQETVVHTIPSGILHSGTCCVIASGVVLDVEGVCEEIRTLRAAGHLQDSKQLMISESATLILPIHKALDSARENVLAIDERIGTTGKGIGPAYEDRASRQAITFGDLYNKSILRKKLAANLFEKNLILEKGYNQPGFDVNNLYSRLEQLAGELEMYRCKDSSLVIHRALKSGKFVVFEGAQGVLLDLFHGTYPYVTSSSTLAGSACVGTGVGPTSISKVIGAFKAYATRVGGGPFPTELHDELGDFLRQKGKEFGSTTGRPRRCGWLDLVALRYSIRLNGITHLALMKLDVLSHLDRIGVCTGYRSKDGGEIINEYPPCIHDLAELEPVIEYLPGWREDLGRLDSLRNLPRAATNYIDFVGNFLGTPIDVISVGPERDQTLWVKPLFSL